MNILVRKGAETSFILKDKTGTDVTATVLPGLNIAANYTDVGTTPPFNQWRYASFEATNVLAGTDLAYSIENTSDVFHLGILNGNPNADAFYGYFSDFSVFDPSTFIVETGGPGAKKCAGVTLQLHAEGGTKYLWTPSTYLNDPTSATPVATNIMASINYNVNVSGACGFNKDISVPIIVGDVTPEFTVDTIAGCSPFTIRITNKSIGAGANKWDFNSDGDFDDLGEGENSNASFLVPLEPNLTNNVRIQNITLFTTSTNGACNKSFTKKVFVYPNVKAQFALAAPTPGCHPLSAIFTNQSTGNLPGASYHWEFGDGGTSSDGTTNHTFSNFDLTPKTYRPLLRITDKYNFCSDTTSLPITVEPYIKASFVISDIENCSPLITNINDDSKGAVSQRYWDFNGDKVFEVTGGTSSTKTYNHSNLLTTNMKYDSVMVGMYVTNTGGCKDTLIQKVKIYPQPDATITSMNNNGNALGCSPLTMTFTGSYTGSHPSITSTHWLIEKSAIENVLVTNYKFENFGAAPVTDSAWFAVTNTFGCVDTVKQSVLVQPFVKADFTLDKLTGCSPLTVAVNNISSIGCDVNKFAWDLLNNGSTEYSTKDVPSKSLTITSPKIDNTVYTYPIKLTASNTAGCTSSIVKDVVVNPQPSGTFSYLDATNPNHCAPFLTTFNPAVVNTETYSWTFGTQGNSFNSNPIFEFNNTTGADIVVPVTLVASNSFGCSVTIPKTITVKPEVKANFTLDKYSGCNSFTVSANAFTVPNATYTWTYDANPPVTGLSQTFTIPANNTGLDAGGYHDISLTTSIPGCSVTTLPKKVLAFPVIAASIVSDKNPASGCHPLDIAFTGSRAYYLGTNALVANVLWSFGDNTSSALQVPPVHQYKNSGVEVAQPYTTTLVATSKDGCVATAPPLNVSVFPAATAAFNVEVIDKCYPMVVKVTDASQTQSKPNTTYTWTTVGGVGATGTNGDSFNLTYTNPDLENPLARTIKLSITNGFGCSSSAPDYNFSVDPKVTAAVTAPVDKICAPGKLTFLNGSTGGTLSFKWDFGDTEILYAADRLSKDHLFANRTAGSLVRTVTLTATNAKGCTSSSSVPVTIYPEVDANYSLVKLSNCTPYKVEVKDQSLNGNEWLYSFGHTILGTPRDTTVTVAGLKYGYWIDNESATDIKRYTVSLRVNDKVTGCWDTISRKIDVYPLVTSVMSVSPLSGCTPLPITFTNGSAGVNTTAGAGSFLWELSNGLSFTQAVPNPMSLVNTSSAVELPVNITLTTSNIIGCKAVSSTTVNVAPVVRSSFSTSVVAGCDPFTSTFKNLAPSPAYNYSWLVDGVPMGTSADYNHPFTNLTNPPVTQNPNVELRVTYKNNATCAATSSQVVKVYPRVYPNFTFVNNISDGCHPFTAGLTNTTLAEGGVATYLWTLGNGTSSTDVSPAAIKYINEDYVNDKPYTINLRATSKDGCVDQTSKVVTVHAVPKVEFKLAGPNAGCAPWPITFNNTSVGNTMTYSWDFGNGNTYVDITGKSYSELFDNNNSYVESFQVKLVGTSQYGCSANLSQMVFAYPHVKANFAFNPGDKACNPFEVDLVNQSQNTHFYTWTFDDGQGSALVDPHHRFENKTIVDQVFKVKLRSESTYGCWDEIIHDLTVYAAPVADFQPVPPLQIFPNATFTLDNKTAPAGPEPTWTYKWSLGDGQVRTGKNFNTYTYSKWGPASDDFRYLVTLETANEHCNSAISKYLTLLPAAPVAYYTSDTSATCSPLNVYFKNTSSYGDRYEWDFGDGSPISTDAEPFHSFTKPGYYNVKLSVYGDGGVAYKYKTYRVFQSPIADFKINSKELLLPEADAHFFNASQFASRYLWDFDDGGGSSTDVNPTYRYSKLGEYNVKLTAWTSLENGNCVDDTTIAAAVRVTGQGKLAYPNAFTPSVLGPNGGVYDDVDYQNQVFHPVWEGVTEYTLRIFNRWGEQIFESKDVKIGWDGYYKGKLCDPDVYVWKAEGRYTNGKSFSKLGDVTLIR
jgi:gliding motility-associated-like protein